MIKPWIAEHRSMTEVERKRVLYQAVGLVSGVDLLRLCGSMEHAMVFKGWLQDCRQEVEADRRLEKSWGFARPVVLAVLCLVVVVLMLGVVPTIEFGWRW